MRYVLGAHGRCPGGPAAPEGGGTRGSFLGVRRDVRFRLISLAGDREGLVAAVAFFRAPGRIEGRGPLGGLSSALEGLPACGELGEERGVRESVVSGAAAEPGALSGRGHGGVGGEGVEQQGPTVRRRGLSRAAPKSGATGNRPVAYRVDRAVMRAVKFASSSRRRRSKRERKSVMPASRRPGFPSKPQRRSACSGRGGRSCTRSARRLGSATGRSC